MLIDGGVGRWSVYIQNKKVVLTGVEHRRTLMGVWYSQKAHEEYGEIEEARGGRKVNVEIYVLKWGMNIVGLEQVWITHS